MATSYYIESESTNESVAFAEYGSTVTLTATDKDENYFFIGWYNGEELVSEEKTISFKVEKDVVYTVKYGCYTLTVDKNVNGGTVSDYSGTPVKEGKQITITANTAAGYTFVGWYNGEVLLTSELNYTFTMPKENITYTAKWVKVGAESNNTSAGTVTALNGRYKVGEEVTVTATTKSGYTFVGWFNGEELLSSELSYTFAVPAVDTIFTAKWTKVTLSRNNTNAGTISSLTGKYIVGDEVTITASTRDGYTFVGWYEGDKFLTNELSYSFKMPSTEMTFTAQWIECPVTLEKSITSAGYVSGLSGPTRVGEEVTITAETYNGYTWIGWYDDETELTKESSYTFVMSATERTLTAKWESYTITTVIGDVRGGSITGMSNVRTTAGESVTIKATTSNGYMWMGWYNGETLVSSNQEYTFAMPAESVVYTALWMACPVTLDQNIADAGSVSGMGNTTTVGEEITITATTNDGYTWIGWYNGEILLTKDTSYIFKMPTENITYTACWAIYTLTTAVNNSNAGEVTAYESHKISAGEEITIEANTNDGYTFIGWYNGDVLLSEDELYKFTMPSESVIYTAKWDAYTLTLKGTTGGSVATNEQKYIVSFDLNGVEGIAPQPQLVTSSAGIAYPDVPISQGYVFVGWYKDKEGTEKYDFTSDISSDLVLYAKWHKITTTGNRNSSIDIISNYNSSSSYYYSSNTNTSSSNPNYVYFSTLTSGDYSFYYRTQESSSTYATYFYVYNVTQNKVILANTRKYSTSYSTVSFTAKEGDVIYVRAYKYSSSTSATSSYMFYIEGAEYPVAGGKAVYSPVSYNVTKGKDVSLSATTLPGYTFIGWFNGETRVSTELTYNFTMPSKNVEYTAKWKECPVTLEKNIFAAGTISGVEDPTRIGDTVVISAQSNLGYTWIGWYNGDTLLTTEQTYSFIMSEEGCVYTAKWARYTLTTSVNDEKAGTLNSEYYGEAIVAGQKVTVSATTNEGYTFLGWYNGEILLSDKLEFTFDMPESSVVYTAKWAYYTFGVEAGVGGSVNGFKAFATVTFDYNDGSGTVKTQRVTATQGLTYPGVIYRTGYVFRGWFSDSDCTKLFDFTADITNDIVVYAGWYEITINGYSTSVIDISSSYKTSSSPYTTSNGSTSDTSAKYVYFTALNGGTYTFYYKTSSSSSSYATYFYVYNVTKNQVILSNTRRYSTSYASSTFTANAGDVIYIRTYRSNTNYSSNYSFYITGGIVPSAGGAFEGINKNVNTDGIGVVAGEQITISATSDYGYIWLGWYDGDECVSTDMTYTFSMPAKSVVYTAKWTYYSVTTGQNISEAGNITYKNDEPVAVGDNVTISATSNYGYIWLGWYDGDELISTDMTYTFDMPAKSVVYTAKWTYYSVTTEQNKDSAGSITHKDDEPIKVGDSVTITASTNDGYTWLGWYNGETLLTTELSYVFVMPENNVVYTAKWIECPITLEKNIESAGEVTGNEKTVLGQETTITAITNDGYTFIGWYNNNDLVTDNLTYTFTVSENVVTYTSKWIECPVTLNKNIAEAGDVSGVEKTIINTDTTISATTQEGYTWLGWYIGDELISTQEEYTFKLTEVPVTYTAKWDYAEITLHYIVNGEEVNSQKYQLNEQLENLWDYGGSNFSGWHLSKNFNSGDLTVASTENLILTDNNAYLYGGTYSGTAGLILQYSDECYEVVGYSGTLTEVTIPSSFNGLPVSSIAQSAFMNHSELTQVVIPNSISIIAEGAFSGCGGLQSMTIPFVGGRNISTASESSLFGYIFGNTNYSNSVLVRQKYAYNRTNSYYVPANLTTIRVAGGNILYGAFYGCESIKTIEIDDSITSIGHYAFAYSGISSLELPSNLVSDGLGQFVIAGCEDLTELTIVGSSIFKSVDNCIIKGTTIVLGCSSSVIPTDQSTAKTIGAYAFAGATLSAILIPDNITRIYEYAFADCISAKTLNFGSGLTTIGNYAFRACESLTQVEVPENVTSIGLGAFGDCIVLQEITLPFVGGSAKTENETNQYPFGYIFGTSAGAGSTQQYYHANSTTSVSQTTYYIPTSLKTVIITGGNILYGAFYNCNNLESITLPQNLKSIKEHAFHGCESLLSITIPSGVTELGEYIFYGCGSLGSISIPDTVTEIKSYSFSGCKSLGSLTLPKQLEEIGEHAFEGCVILKNLTIPSTVSYIGGYAFYNCASLTSMVIPKTQISLGAYTFYGCTSLQKVTMPNPWCIGEYAFYNCINLTSITYTAYAGTGGDRSIIGEYAFYNCKALTKFTMPKYLKEIEPHAFEGCEKLATVTFDSGDIIGIGSYAFYGCKSLTSISIPNTSTSNYLTIADYAFAGCSKLSKVTISSNYNGIRINNYVFADCVSLTSFTISDAVYFIGHHAFSGCSKLTSVTFGSTRTWSLLSSDSSGGKLVTTSSSTDKSTAARLLTETYVKYSWTI